METPPPEKSLEKISFSTQVARGVIRDPRARRWTMFGLLIGAMLMVFVGATFLEDQINPRQHLGWFLVFWCACAWLTITALLLAIFDLLIVRREARGARTAFRSELSKKTNDRA